LPPKTKLPQAREELDLVTETDSRDERLDPMEATLCDVLRKLAPRERLTTAELAAKLGGGTDIFRMLQTPRMRRYALGTEARVPAKGPNKGKTIRALVWGRVADPTPSEAPVLRLVASAPARTSPFSNELAKLLGVKGAENAGDATTNLDAALEWAERGVPVFPCKRFLGRPLVEKWYAAATTTTNAIVEWWEQWPNADIGAALGKPDHFVVAAFDDEGGIDSLVAFEEQHGELPAEFHYEDCWGNEFWWMRGHAYTSHHKLGRGIHVLGTGHRVFMPPSLAPHIIYR
jgi:hypothetical protein